MTLEEEYKEGLARLLALRLALAIKRGEISSIDLPYVSRQIRTNLDRIQKQDEMIDFLRELTKQWHVFADVLAHVLEEEMIFLEKPEGAAEIKAAL